MSYLLLAINPGSTSTKIAVYSDEKCMLSENIEHDSGKLDGYSTIIQQLPMRKAVIEDWLNTNNIFVADFSAVVGRGGMLPPASAGAWRINKAMIERLVNRPLVPHASNLGAVLAHAIASPYKIPSYIYDPVTVDELDEVAIISGMPLIERKSFAHTLNSRAMARKVAEKLRISYESGNFIVAHLGGGISISSHHRGRMIDVIADDEGPFSPERAGRVPCRDLISLCYSGRYTEHEMHKQLRGEGGLRAYLGTKDVRRVIDDSLSGDKKSELIIQAMAYQISKGIGEMAVVLKGDVNAVVLTGGIAHSRFFTDLITERVNFIAPVMIEPGENELESLALGVLRVFRGEESAQDYSER